MITIITRIREFFKAGNNPISISEQSRGKVAVWHKRISMMRNLVSVLFLVVVFILSILVAFFTGRVVKFLENKPAFYFESAEMQADYAQKNYESEKESLFKKFQDTKNNSNMIVASSGGTKYYFAWCKGAENIREKNKRYFVSEELAQKAGYTKAASCK